MRVTIIIVLMMLCFPPGSFAVPGARHSVTAKLSRPSYSGGYVARGVEKLPRRESGGRTVVRGGARETLINIDKQYGDEIRRVARLYHVDWRRVAAIVAVESGGDPRARSDKGAMGLMQLMPATAKDMGVVDPWDPRQNIRGGIKYLRYLEDEEGYRGEECLVAYHEGPGGASAYLRRNNPGNHFYVQRVGHVYNAAKEVLDE
ncbi:MAG: hypothetical protein COZ49_02165 [Candidatus Yonathbacteria bacterium CG_4_10_14_3_um_filter_47_65]|uniref:Transglycosylase SLT domain-containing protein n=2 Tax=Parcubacteria group TaxID=1794811 RepID=A0A2M8D5D6_9BACT|nr:MAG: hypothetical protein AUJ44_04010 [Candidatus Nomurabacteria bacterium CG1_02_47_685]PIP03803.1 MAG: hypothetical protein COX54_02340 [Candidatus Yonathbacteria bacterium CG23_combo_of_CG06-09_8_20_14_all_46_18]PIQ32521.1 MAG: hypothetical protein COW61_01480 [Candidatus Yonathbacteria bacterium CG17_big_fil_post_rev_8_21_14_2_50_46_19]PIX56417.1 MAG: hypothetical protein COZ49_02165 [Candidatus Yonathbacteria bacterium CG_4_10_14_3_um_filter_47_65]PIY57962.1 MAG: hypothetical protein CO